MRHRSEPPLPHGFEASAGDSLVEQPRQFSVAPLRANASHARARQMLQEYKSAKLDDKSLSAFNIDCIVYRIPVRRCTNWP